MTEEIKVENYSKFKVYLEKLIGAEKYEKLIEILGGENAVMNASFGMSTDSGSAYEGALVENALAIGDYASKLNKLYPENMQVENKSIYIVALLQHISKVCMYEQNDNAWEIKNRGFVYKFVDQLTALRGGERSLFLIMQAGISLSETEFEALRIIDKTKDDDNYSKYYSGVLTTIIRQANEMVAIINKNKK